MKDGDVLMEKKINCRTKVQGLNSLDLSCDANNSSEIECRLRLPYKLDKWVPVGMNK